MATEKTKISPRPAQRRRTGRTPAIPLTADLALHIRRTIAERGMTQEEAAQILGITQPNMSYLKHIHPRRFALPRLLQCLNALGFDVEITVSPSDNKRGETSLTCEARSPPPCNHPPAAAEPLAAPDSSGPVPLKARLANFICATLDRRGITRLEAASLFGTYRQQVTHLYHFLPNTFAVQRLLHFVNVLGHDVEITVTPTDKKRGEISLTIT